MLTGLLHTHNLLRYIIIIVAVWAIVKLISSRNAGKPFGKSEKTPSMLLMILMDVQFLIGIVLFFLTKYITKLQSLPFSEWDKTSKFFVREHVPIMLVSLVLIHIGYSATKKPALPDNKKYSKAITLFLIAFILILAAIPWPFRDLGRGWLPGMA